MLCLRVHYIDMYVCILYCTWKLLDLAGRGLWNKVSASPCEEGGGGRRKEELDEEAEEEEESG